MCYSVVMDRNTGEDMSAFIDELIEKYEDVVNSSDDWVEKNLASEFIEDLKDLRKNG